MAVFSFQSNIVGKTLHLLRNASVTLLPL